MAIIQEYINDLRSLLGSSPIVEQRALLKSFVEEIKINKEEVTFHYTLPMPPGDSTEEVIGVLPFIQHGRPYRSRTFDTLIKSQVDIFTEFGLLSNLESARKVFSF